MAMPPKPSPNLSPIAAGHRTLAHRVDRFLAGLERVPRQPNRREGYHLRVALERLSLGQREEAEEALVKAQHAAPLPAPVANMVETNAPVTTAELRRQLARIQQDEGQQDGM